MHRFYLDGAQWRDSARPGVVLSLPVEIGRHLRVVRLRPGEKFVLFGEGPQEWIALLLSVDDKGAHAELLTRTEVSRELLPSVCLAVGMPANDRMDGLVEKATELGATRIQPLMCTRSVLRLEGERSVRRTAHWQAVAVAATEQCGRTVPPHLDAPLPFEPWLAARPWLTWPTEGQSSTSTQPPVPLCLVLSLRQAVPLPTLLAERCGQRADPTRSLPPVVFLSGPEGGLTEDEEASAVAAGFQPVSLGPRTLRADTAPLAALAMVGACFEARV